MKLVATLLKFNGLVAALWGASFLLDKAHIPFLTIPFGILALFAPAVCLAVALEQISESKLKPVIFGLWLALFSFILTPTAVYGISVFGFRILPVNSIILPFIVWWIICFGLSILISSIKHLPSTLSQFSTDKTTKKELAYILAGFLAIMILNFIIYPLLPEGDGYGLLIKWENIQADPQLLTAETRSLFLVAVNLFANLSKIDHYWIFKIFLPLAHFALILSCYSFVRSFIDDSRYRVLLSLAPLYFPVILQEILISRPQSLLLIAFLPTLAILADNLGENQNLRRIYWLLALLVVNIVGIKVHTLFALLTLICAISIVIFLRREIAKKPLDALAIALASLILLWPHIIQTRLIPDSLRLIELFTAAFSAGKFEWWFIDHYRNVDGTEIGWPGLTAFYYYGYNLGLVFPMFAIWSLVSKKIQLFRPIFSEKYWAVIFLFLFFFFIAEIAPRFQIAYLPDRAWLFLALLLSLILPLFVSVIKKMLAKNFLKP